MDERDRIDEEAQLRRRRIAALAVALPILAGLLIAGIVYIAGGNEETDITKPEGEATASRHLVEAATPAEAGTPAPRVRLTEGGTGKDFDGASLGSEPYAVVFISTRCASLGGFLRRVAADLGPGEGAVLAISADPQVDSPDAVARYLSQNQLQPGGPVRYLLGDEDELRGYWNAWGFDGPAPNCTESIPAYLVSGAGKNAGILDVAPSSPAALLTSPLSGMAK
jgi:cytochrome oxidase Cu insertion factor (SCO1/SenC/PrrC family)